MRLSPPIRLNWCGPLIAFLACCGCAASDASASAAATAAGQRPRCGRHAMTMAELLEEMRDEPQRAWPILPAGNACKGRGNGLEAHPTRRLKLADEFGR